MKSIFIVTAGGGDTDDYRILGVFDSLDKAEDYVSTLNTHDRYDSWIEQWGLNSDKEIETTG